MTNETPAEATTTEKGIEALQRLHAHLSKRALPKMPEGLRALVFENAKKLSPEFAMAAGNVNNGFRLAAGEPPIDLQIEAYAKALLHEVERLMREESPSDAWFLVRDDEIRANHTAWLTAKLKAGWRWGEEENREEKISPYLLPYDEMPPRGKAKAAGFISTAKLLHRAAYDAAIRTWTRAIAEGIVGGRIGDDEAIHAEEEK